MPNDQSTNEKPDDGLKKKPGESNSVEYSENENPGEDGEEFLFIQERIKPKSVSGKKILTRFIQLALSGLVFGACACFAFYALKPSAESGLQDDQAAVDIPDEEEQGAAEEVEDTMADPAAETITIPEMTVDNLIDMTDSLYDIVKEADKSVVSIRQTKTEDWAVETTDLKSGSGVIAADNGRELLILADNAICTDAEGWTVTFADKKQYPASLKTQDKNRGLAVFSVERAAIADSTWNAVSVATFGNSNSCVRGDIVIALGNIFGYGGGFSYGIISSKSYDTVFADSRCGVIATDISLSEAGTGILYNEKGEVIGLIRSGIWKESGGSTANALAISDLKQVLEKLLAGESVPYVGLNGISVTEEISMEHSIPQGFYVTQVQEDSPAMTAGIQNGDVITEVHGTAVTGQASYTKAVEECSTGDTIKIRGQRRGNGGFVEVEFTVTVGSRE